MSIQLERIDKITNQLLNGVTKGLNIKEDYAFLEDKVTNVVRTRVNAEFCSTLINLHKAKKGNHKDLIEKLANWLIRSQNPNGSWNEKHQNYDKPSSVFTAICALSVLDVKDIFPDMSISDGILENAAKFLVEQEIAPGYFRKSEYSHSDILNADAMTAAFLVRFGTQIKNEEFIKVGKRAISNVCAQQFMDGAYPYGGPMRAYPYKYHFYVPCIHYQTVTSYYLLKCLPFVRSDFLEHSIDIGTRWLLKNQKENGTFNWKKSGLNFALYLSATYALAIPLYLNYINKDKTTTMMISKSLDVIQRQIMDGILLRWEKGNTMSFMKGVLDAPSGGFIGDYPFSFKILRMLHRIQREASRGRVSNQIVTSKLATRSKGYSAFLGTVESSTNYPDLYMTTEALDALSSTFTNGTVIE